MLLQTLFWFILEDEVFPVNIIKLIALIVKGHEFDFLRLKDFFTVYLILAISLTILIDNSQSCMWVQHPLTLYINIYCLFMSLTTIMSEFWYSFQWGKEKKKHPGHIARSITAPMSVLYPDIVTLIQFYSKLCGLKAFFLFFSFFCWNSMTGY